MLTHPSIIAIGLAAVASGVAISSVSAYRHFNVDSGPTYTSLRGDTESFSTQGSDGNPLICLQSEVTETLTSSDSEAGDGEESKSQPEKLLGLKFKELEKEVTSSGERFFVNEETHIPKDLENRQQQIQAFKENKEQGVKHYANGKYQEAVSKFKVARAAHKNSPENLIYLNNALANKSGKSYTLAVTAPLKGGVAGTDLDTAMAILKGAAHAQDDINRAGGIKGVPIKLLIADDFDNSAQSAEAVAKILTQKQDVLGVIGHDAASATAAARKIYEKANLASITPTSTSAALPPGNTSGLRSVPNDTVPAKLLAEYALYQERGKVAIFYSQGSDEASNRYSQTVADTFKTSLSVNDDTGKVVQEVNVDPLNTEQFNELLESLEQSILLEKIDTVVLMPSRSDESLKQALQIAMHSREVSKDILILGNDAMYSPKTASCGYKVNNMVVPLFWSMDTDKSLSTVSSDFVSRASNPDNPNSLWDTEINWMSATTYDAVIAFSQALAENYADPQRAKLSASLKQPLFSIDGATGFIKFDTNGERIGSSMKLFKVLPENNDIYSTDSQFTFQPIFFE